jgi:hypothetical protein
LRAVAARFAPFSAATSESDVVDMKFIACSIFRREMEAVAPEIASQTTWLPAGLHVDLGRLQEALRGAMEGNERVVCFYGAACHPQMDELVAAHAGHCLPGKDCVAAFLPYEERRKLEGRKAFVITPGWLRNWREIFREGLGWDEVDARQNFGLYEVVVLLDFGLEVIDDMAVLEFFEYVHTPIEIVPTGLEYFRDNVKHLLQAAYTQTDSELDR